MKIALYDLTPALQKTIVDYLTAYGEERREACNLTIFCGESISFEKCFQTHTADVMFLSVHSNVAEVVKQLQERQQQTCFVFLTQSELLPVNAYMRYLKIPIAYHTFRDLLENVAYLSGQ